MDAASATSSAPPAVLSYLGLPVDYQPSPDTQPLQFLAAHLRQLPPQLLPQFSSTTTPKQRSSIPAIRNRRLRYTASNPQELNFESAKANWPTLWPGRERPGQQRGDDEREWAEKFFLGSSLKPHVGKLGMLLGGYEEEREAEHVRSLRRAQAEELESLPEEDESSDEEEGEEPLPLPDEEEPYEDSRTLFLRKIKERFIYGLLESVDYDKVDWDDSWDADNDRDAEERWFDAEEESSETLPSLSDHA
ncbi:uncharacterized protein FIBRA_06207 [Fibroporia radiculosa]|uniref:CCD97-like C-terminal domain-containing protein n=1 Tax=Fibroporia radiculosa TaxID=599839 RepID=J4GAT8_9APHY|nr:uncharacterized protein FIBRA_06207 [Fibroporia radiculosa]CCM04048.1 predicted protein [Fibroporia radiculosa]